MCQQVATNIHILICVNTDTNVLTETPKVSTTSKNIHILICVNTDANVLTETQ